LEEDTRDDDALALLLSSGRLNLKEGEEERASVGGVVVVIECAR
jgi:hypothetical protein